MNQRGGDYQKERGERQRQKIVFAVGDGMLSAEEIASIVCLTRSAVLLHIQRMREAKQVRIAGYREQSRSREIPLYGLGAAPDAVYVRLRDRGDVFARRKAMFQAILEKLGECNQRGHSATAPELAILLGVANPTMRKYLPLMREANLIYRSGWVKRTGGGQGVAVWSVGDKPDVPESSTLLERRGSPLSQEQRDLVRRRRDAWENVRRIRKAPQGIFAALGI
jgi:hypothetical protein